MTATANMETIPRAGGMARMRQARRGLPTKWIRPPLSELSAWRTDPAGHGKLARVGDRNVSYFAISLACASAIDKMMSEKILHTGAIHERTNRPGDVHRLRLTVVLSQYRAY